MSTTVTTRLSVGTIVRHDLKNPVLFAEHGNDSHENRMKAYFSLLGVAALYTVCATIPIAVFAPAAGMVCWLCCVAVSKMALLVCR